MAHFSVVSLTQVVLLLVLICWTSSSTGAAFSLEEEFLQLKENYIQMKQIVKSLEAKDEQMEAQLELNNKLRQDLALKVIQLEAKNVQLEVKIGKLEAKVEQQDSLFKNSFSRGKNERTAATDFNSVSINNNQSAVFINGLPSSCGDLKLIGHTLNGIYSVMGSAKMESVFCDFSQTPENFQKFIGYADVKSAPVHFYVQRSTSFSTRDIPVPFDLARVNEGNAMDLTTGIFTAPAPGIYFFSFAGTAHLRSSSAVQFSSHLYLNGIPIGSSFVQNKNVDQLSPVTLQSTLNLKTGDQLWVKIWYTDGSSSYLLDNNNHYTHFTGFMLEEEIGASL